MGNTRLQFAVNFPDHPGIIAGHCTPVAERNSFHVTPNLFRFLLVLPNLPLLILEKMASKWIFHTVMREQRREVMWD